MDTMLELVVRFTHSIPDLSINITSPLTTTTLALKRKIRGRLPSPASTSRLRLIHAGRLLPDAEALSTSLAPRLNITYARPRHSDSVKGKEPAGNLGNLERIYIHCSVGDPLTATELAQEAVDAESSVAALISAPPDAVPSTTDSDLRVLPSSRPGTGPHVAVSHVLGFDRLLSAGFTHAEVATLRSQFLAIQAQTHTPDTMPRGVMLRALEDQWLDSGAEGAPGVAAGDEQGLEQSWARSGFTTEDGLEDMLLGNVVGFFWPIGALVWGFREEGVWTRRRQIAVMTGLMVNLAFGILRWTS